MDNNLFENDDFSGLLDVFRFYNDGSNFEGKVNIDDFYIDLISELLNLSIVPGVNDLNEITNKIGTVIDSEVSDVMLVSQDRFLDSKLLSEELNASNDMSPEDVETLEFFKEKLSVLDFNKNKNKKGGYNGPRNK